MRAAGTRLKEFYGTQLGQDVIETLGVAGLAAGSQAMFTDMTPQEIAIATALGIGAATVGRPIGGRIGQAVGNKLGNSHPSVNAFAKDMSNPEGMPEMLKEIVATKYAPYAHLQPAAQVGQVIGRTYGDNIVQGLVGLGAPLIMNGNENA